MCIRCRGRCVRCSQAPGVQVHGEASGRFEVTEPDPVRLAESERRHLRTEAAEAAWPEYRTLIQAT